MIKINLAARKKSGFGGVKISGTRAGLDLRERLSGLKDLPLKKLLVPGAAALVLYLSVDEWKDSKIKELDAQIAQVTAEKPRLEAEANKMKEYEQLRKDLEASEKALNLKLAAIRKLIEGRNSTVTILVDLSKIIPKAVWLTDFQIKGPDLLLKGMSNDFEPITDLVKALNENQFFHDAVPIKQTQDDQKKSLVAFELQAKKR